VVTGGNGGLGLETVRELARNGAHVVMAARDQEKARRAESDVLASHPGSSVEIVELDLAALDSIRSAAASIAGHYPVDILVDNAGLMATDEDWTNDGFEMQFGVNHLGHFAFTALLLPQILRAPAARVVTVTSTGRHYGRQLDPDNPHLAGKYTPWAAYGQAKMANLQFAVGLNRQFEDAGVAARAFSAQPGFVDTDLQARSVDASSGGATQRFFHTVVSRYGMTPADGARSILRAATDPNAKGGSLYGPRFLTHGPPIRLPLTGRGIGKRAIRNLWMVSEAETGIELDVTETVSNLQG